MRQGTEENRRLHCVQDKKPALRGLDGDSSAGAFRVRVEGDVGEEEADDVDVGACVEIEFFGGVRAGTS